MINSQAEIQQDYQKLRSKVQNQIKALQRKLTQNSEIRYHRTANKFNNNLTDFPIETFSPRNIVKQIPDLKNQSPHHVCHNLHSANCCNKDTVSQVCQQCKPKNHACQAHSERSSRSNSRANKLQDTENQFRFGETPRTRKQQFGSKISEHNELLENAFAQSLQNQKQIANNLKSLEQKISKLEIASNLQKSSSSEKKFQQQTSRKSSHSKPQSNKKRLQVLSQRDLGKYYKDDVFEKKSKNKTILPKSKGKNLSKKSSESSNSQGYFFNRAQNKFKLNNAIPQLNINHSYDQYFGFSKICPVHTSPLDIKLIQNQVYHDSNYRNRKHQRNHLIQSFKQQQISRKKLMDKILKSGLPANNK